MLQPFRDQPHTVIQYEDAGRIGRASGHIDQNRVTIMERGFHAVALNGHDPQ